MKKQKGYKVVSLDTIVDASFINTMESKWEKVHFVRVDADIADNLIDKQESTASVLSKEEEDKLKAVMDVLISLRKEARAKKDWATSDKIRNQLLEVGIQLKDEKDGNMSWSLS